MRLTWLRKVYTLKFPFKLSYGTFTERVGYLVKLEEGSYEGWGEMSFVPYYNKQESDIQRQLEMAADFVARYEGDWNPPDIYDDIVSGLNPDPFILSSMDCALYDLYGKKKGMPVWEILGATKDIDVISSLTVTEDDWREKLKWGWPVWKLKMGFEGDMELLGNIRENFDGTIRIDANSGWSRENLEENVARMKDWNIELIEQPLPNDDDSTLASIIPDVPFAADESFQGLESLTDMVDKYQIINIKLQKCGGITPAMRIIKKARAMGLKLMAGCMTESSVGIGAMCQLAGFFDYLDVDGEYLINFDFGESLFLDQGRVVLNELPGFGKRYVIV